MKQYNTINQHQTTKQQTLQKQKHNTYNKTTTQAINNKHTTKSNNQATP